MELTDIVKPLLAWYDGNARVLPWREDATPYRVWVSEIMLQQTRVEAVKPYFERFTRELPDVQALARVPEDRLLKLWEGLGYYNRVRNMQKAAQKVVNECAGELPADYQQLLALPGIGSYTAGAIASIAYQICVPAVDGNVLRVVSRLTASRDDIWKQSVKKRMELQVGDVIPAERPGAFNQALMELGAMICVPNGMARCDSCPLRELCEARKQGIVMELPQKAPKKARKLEDRTILVVRDGEKVAIHRRPPKGLLAGLYEFPNLEGFLSDDEVLAFLKGRKLSPIRIQKLEPSKHIFSHIEWHMIGYVVRVEELEDMDTSDWIFIEPQDTRRDYPIPAAFGAYTKYMNIKWGLDNN